MGNTCSSIGGGPSNSNAVQGRRLPASDDEERQTPPAGDAGAQLAIVLQNRAMGRAGCDSLACLRASTWLPQPDPQAAPAAAGRTRLLVRVQNLGWQLLQFLPFRDLSVLATAAEGFRTVISQHPAYLQALAVHSYVINPLTDVKLLKEADEEMRAYMRLEHALVEKLAGLMGRSGWPTRTVLKLMSELSPEKFGNYVEIDSLLRKAEAGTINEREQRWLCLLLASFEPVELIEEAIAQAAQGMGHPIRDLARRTAIHYCVSEVHDLAERSKNLKAREEELKLLPKHSLALLKAKYAHTRERDAIHCLSEDKRDQLVALAARLAAVRDEDPRPPGLLGRILDATEQLQARNPAHNGRIQTRKLLSTGFEHVLNEHLVECKRWQRVCSEDPIDMTLIDFERVGMAWSRAQLPVSALQAMSEAIRLAHHDKGAALRVQFEVLRGGLLSVATTSLIDHYSVDSNPTVSFSSSPPAASPMAASEYTYAHVDRITGKAYPAETYVHIGDKPFAKRFIVTNERGEIVHVRTHVFNARRRGPFPVSDAPVVMHFDESKAHRAPG